MRETGINPEILADLIRYDLGDVGPSGWQSEESRFSALISPLVSRQAGLELAGFLADNFLNGSNGVSPENDTRKLLRLRAGDGDRTRDVQLGKLRVS